MGEYFLQMVWQKLWFDFRELKTTKGESLQILFPGYLNLNQGPDFLEARIRINHQIITGPVEIHLKGDDWFKHQHHEDPGYSTVVLHVVSERGTMQAITQNGKLIPEIEIGELISENARQKYDQLSRSISDLPCDGQLHLIPDSLREEWLAQVWQERLHQKVEKWERLLNQFEGDLHRVWLIQLGPLMGGPVNGPLFCHLLESIPWRVMPKLRDNPDHLEALLLGMGGFLYRTKERGYIAELQSQWMFLKYKYNLKELTSPNWKYLRMRPIAFPEVRISLTAALWKVFQGPPTESHESLLFTSTLQASSYWATHSRMGVICKPRPIPIVGENLRRLLWMNVWLPGILLRRKMAGKKSFSDFPNLKLPPEENRITRRFQQAGMIANTAAEAQALIGLYKEYCSGHRCLNCAFGQWIIAPFDSIPEKK